MLSFVTVLLISSAFASESKVKVSFELVNYNSNGILFDGNSCDSALSPQCDSGLEICMHRQLGILHLDSDVSYCPTSEDTDTTGWMDTGTDCGISGCDNGVNFNTGQTYGTVTNPTDMMSSDAWRGWVVKVKAYDCDNAVSDCTPGTSDSREHIDDLVYNFDTLPVGKPLTVKVTGQRPATPASELTIIMSVECQNSFEPDFCNCRPTSFYHCTTNGTKECVPDYFDTSKNCTVHCVGDTQVPPRFTCDAMTGEKCCTAGWEPEGDCTMAITTTTTTERTTKIFTTVAPIIPTDIILTLKEYDSMGNTADGKQCDSSYWEPSCDSGLIFCLHRPTGVAAVDNDASICPPRYVNGSSGEIDTGTDYCGPFGCSNDMAFQMTTYGQFENPMLQKTSKTWIGWVLKVTTYDCDNFVPSTCDPGDGKNDKRTLIDQFVYKISDMPDSNKLLSLTGQRQIKPSMLVVGISIKEIDEE